MGGVDRGRGEKILFYRSGFHKIKIFSTVKFSMFTYKILAAESKNTKQKNNNKKQQ